MGGMIENLLLTSHLHNLPEIHHRHIVADEAHNAEIMGDEKIGQSHLFLHILQNGDNLYLNRHIQGGDRLVTDHKFLIRSQSPLDTDTLELQNGKMIHFMKQD